MENIGHFKAAAKNYLKARNKFLLIADKTEFLFGNDNLVGRIGEFIAFQYLQDVNRTPKRVTSKTQKGYDLLCDDGHIRVSVKTITSENKNGTTTRISEPWDELIIITLNSKGDVEKFGIITKIQFERALNAGHLKSKHPYARRSMVEPNGLIGNYGVIVPDENVKNYI